MKPFTPRQAARVKGQLDNLAGVARRLRLHKVPHFERYLVQIALHFLLYTDVRAECSHCTFCVNTDDSGARVELLFHP